MVNNIYLYGTLEEQFGHAHKFACPTPAHGIRAMCGLHKGFAQQLRQGEYHVLKGNTALEAAQLTMRMGRNDLHIIPIPEGSKGGGTGKAIIGTLLLATAIIAAPFTAGASTALAASQISAAGTYGVSVGAGIGTFGTVAAGLSASATLGTMATLGAAIALGGISQMLSPTPRVGDYSEREKPDERASFLLNGRVNPSEQGLSVPVLYGMCRIGSTAVAGGLSVEKLDVQLSNASTAGQGGRAGSSKLVCYRQAGTHNTFYQKFVGVCPFASSGSILKLIDNDALPDGNPGLIKTATADGGACTIRAVYETQYDVDSLFAGAERNYIVVMYNNASISDRPKIRNVVLGGKDGDYFEGNIYDVTYSSYAFTATNLKTGETGTENLYQMRWKTGGATSVLYDNNGFHKNGADTGYIKWIEPIYLPAQITNKYTTDAAATLFYGFSRFTSPDVLEYDKQKAGDFIDGTAPNVRDINGNTIAAIYEYRPDGTSARTLRVVTTDRSGTVVKNLFFALRVMFDSSRTFNSSFTLLTSNATFTKRSGIRLDGATTDYNVAQWEWTLQGKENIGTGAAPLNTYDFVDGGPLYLEFEI